MVIIELVFNMFIINMKFILINTTHCLFYPLPLGRMNHPWLKDTIQYDPYEEPDYPQPEEAPTDLPKWILLLKNAHSVDTARPP